MAESVRRMFARIATRYDLANRLLSGGQDLRWRRRALGLLRTRRGHLLDVACGTFDLGLDALRHGQAARVTALDFCVPMMQAGRGKRRGRAIAPIGGDALRLPFPDASFDAVIIAYGWRNVDDPAAALREFHRVLVPGGELLVLEFFRPQRTWTRLFQALFCRRVMPLLGGILTGDAAAYRYLHRSIVGFLALGEAEDLCRHAGFDDLRTLAFFGGVSHALVARRAPAGT